MINNRRYYSVDLSFPKFTSSSDFDVLGYFKLRQDFIQKVNSMLFTAIL